VAFTVSVQKTEIKIPVVESTTIGVVQLSSGPDTSTPVEASANSVVDAAVYVAVCAAFGSAIDENSAGKPLNAFIANECDPNELGRGGTLCPLTSTVEAAPAPTLASPCRTSTRFPNTSDVPNKAIAATSSRAAHIMNEVFGVVVESTKKLRLLSWVRFLSRLPAKHPVSKMPD
jgi:hypothetical protein